MSDARLPINHGDTGKVSRDKINDSFNDLVTTVAGYRPHIESGIWWIGNTNTGVQAIGDSVEMKVDDGYIWYKSSSINSWTQIIAIEDLKGDKGDTGDAATVCVGTVCTGAAGSDVCVTNSGTQYAAVLNFTIPQGATGCTGATGASICAAEFCGDDMVFTKDNGCTVTLTGAKTDLKGDQGCPGCNGCNGCNGQDGADGASICAAAFSGDDIVFTRDDSCTVTLANAKTCLKGADGLSATVSVGTTTTGGAGSCACVTNTGTCSAAVLDFVIPTGAEGPAGNGIACVTSTKAGKVTTVDITCTNGCSYCFTVSDGEDGQGSGDMLKCVYDPNNISADAFDYCNFTNTPPIPTDNCQLANGCGYTTCTGTLTSSNISNVAYGLQWSGVVTDAPSKKVMYDKLKTYDAIIPSAATCSNQLADKDYVNDSINSVTAYYITKNAGGDQFATYAELAAATTFYSGGVARTPTRNDYTIVLDDENHDHATTRYIYNSGWEYQYTVNETALTTAQMNALNSGITAAKVSTYDGYATSKQDALTASANIDITCNKISATNNYIITEAITCTTYTGTLGVAPYNTSYCYTNICIDPSSGVARKEGSVYTFDIDTKMIATSACRNVRVKIGSGDYIPVMGTSSILAGSSYFTKANTRQYMYSTKYQSCGALHLFTDSNTTYSAMSNAEATTGTCTSARSIAACTLKCAIDACGYTTCTGTLSSCADVISALGYTPYNSTNPSGYTTCTGTLSATNTGCNGQVLTKTSSGATWCDAASGGDTIQLAPNTEYSVKYHWYGPQACYDALSQYYTDTANDTAYFTI